MKRVRYLFTVGIFMLLVLSWGSSALAATIGGSVTNNSGQTGRIFLRVFWNNGGPGHWGKSIPSAGAYSIRGVPDGSYVVAGFIDKNDDGIPNSSEATALSGTINISGGTVSGSPNLTFDSSPSATPVAVGNLTAAAFDGSVLLFWDQPVNQNGAIEADSYQVEWSTNNFTNIIGSSPAPFKVGSGMEEDGMYFVSPLTNNVTYQFRVKSIIGAQTATSAVVSATPNAPSQGHSISGTFNLPGNITVPANTPIIVIAEGPDGEPFFVKAIQTFANGTPFSVGGIPNGYYHLFALVDMNKDNRPSTGDYWTDAIQVTINGANETGKTLTVAALKAIPSMEIDHVFDDFSSPTQYYGVQGYIEAGSKRPVNIYITGPAFIRHVTDGGVDLAWDFDEAGYWQWDNTRPQPGVDQYSFQVEYSDGTPGETHYTYPSAVYDSPVPNNVTPIGNITAMPANITWTANVTNTPDSPSAALPAGWVVDVSIMGRNVNFFWEPDTLPAPTATSVVYDGQPLPVGQYNLRVQFCEGWDWGCVSRNQEFNIVVGTCTAPSSITVPSSDPDGSYTVSWPASTTIGVTYTLEEAVNNTFTSGLHTVATGITGTSFDITGRSGGTTYYYRVKASKTDYADSDWATAGNGCNVPAPASTITLTPNDASPSPVGTAITFTAAASGGSGSYEYKFLYKTPAGTWVTAQNYSTSATWNWATNSLTGGTYQVVVHARNAGSTAAYETYTSVNYDLTSAATAVTLSPNDASPSPVGTAITFTATASGGSGSYEYKFLYKTPAGAWVTAQNYSTSATWNWATTGLTDGTYQVVVHARNAGSTAAYETYTSVNYDLISTATAVTLSPDDASPSPAGTAITFTAAASGGSGSYEYKFIYKTPAGTWVTAQNYSTSATWNWATNSLAGGTYQVVVHARNAGSTAAYETYKSISYELISAATAVTLSPDDASPSPVGTAITFTAAASGGSGSYEYKFIYKTPAGTWVTARNYSTSATWNWATTGLTGGTYQIVVHARNAGSTAAYETYKSISYELISAAKTVTLSPDDLSPSFAGTSVTFTAAASGGSGSYEYKFIYKTPAGTWVTAQNYSTSATWNWATTGLAGGTYQVVVHARNAGSTAAYETYKSLNYIITVPTLVPNDPSPSLVGTSITFTAGVTGDSGSYEYKFIYKTPAGAWVTAQNYSTIATWDWSTTLFATGTYQIVVHIRNAGSTAAYEAYKSLNYVLE